MTFLMVVIMAALLVALVVPLRGLAARTTLTALPAALVHAAAVSAAGRRERAAAEAQREKDRKQPRNLLH